ncbi:MAG TPA: hypothetical protein VMA53_01300 [Stellaceae bacterium]|nr:hypothetical protein [Stellaceae bacterium]
MFSSDKRASLTSGLLAAKEQALSGEDGASDVSPAASLVTLPRGGARQRLISAVRRKEDAASVEDAAPAADDATSAAAPAEPVAVAPPPPPPPPAPTPAPAQPPNSVLYSKGDASASGFRPWYWSYERDGAPASTDGAGAASSDDPGPASSDSASPASRDSAGSVAQFPTSAPAPVSLPHAVSPGPVSPDPADPDPDGAPVRRAARLRRAAPPPTTEPPTTPRRAAKLGFGLLAGAGTLALVGGATLFLLSRGETPAPGAAPMAVIARALPMASPVPPPPRATRVAPLPKLAAVPVESRHPVAEATSDIAELMTRGDEMLATGDVAAARLFYERAAENGNAAAERQAGKTYDPLFLAQTHVRGLQGDPVAAARWYRKASDGGDREADTLMQRLMARYAR